MAAEEQRSARLDGPDRIVQRQRCNGVLLLAAAEECSGHLPLGQPRGARLAIVTWIETKYNRRRRQHALGKLTPTEFEMIYTAADVA